MQIVINISDIVYNQIKAGLTVKISSKFVLTVLDAIENGTPLPKGHGALKDADKLLETWYDDFCKFMTQTELDSMNNIIKNAPTIIEADKSESEEMNDQR